MKTLYTIGDSWTYGFDLENPKRECYPYLLSQKFGCGLVNEALPAAPNDWMFRKTIEWVCKYKGNYEDLFVIVGWSIPYRREENFKFYYGGPLKWLLSHYGKEEWVHPHSRFISKHFYNNELSTIKSLSYLITLQEFLKSKNINYLFYQPFAEILIPKDKWNRFNKNKGIDPNGKCPHECAKWCDCYWIDGTNYTDMVSNIDKKYLIGPDFGDFDSYQIAWTEERHPNKKEQSSISDFVEYKMKELYSL